LLLTWTGFLVSLAGILIISKKNLALALVSGAIILGLFTLPVETVFDRIVYTLSDSSIILLCLAMGVIPIIGGTMKQSGQIDSLVSNVRIKKRYLLPFSAALMGLLPMPGGALLSAPILERGGEGVSDDLKATINNWFRHLFILVYPLSPALIVAAKICGLDVYYAILHLLPGLLLATILGYIFFLSKVHGSLSYPAAFSWSGLFIPLIIILSAPTLDFILKRSLDIGSLATVIGVTTGLSLSIIMSHRKLDLRGIIREMKPWNFALIILGMFLYLHVFQKTEVGDLIATLPLPPLTLSVIAGFLLGLATGRVQLPASIILPVYLGSVDHITPVVFVLIYVAIYFGYIISPVHPCLVVTCEFFHIPIRNMILKMAAPTLIVFATVLSISIVISH
jgi:integral membrane protein (TIGR00529 family)